MKHIRDQVEGIDKAQIK